MLIESVTDEALAKRAQAGELEAYDEIVHRHQQKLWLLLFKFCPHQSELEDLVQNAFIRAYQKLHQWRATSSFEAWLRRLAVNVGYDYFRSRRNKPIDLAQAAARHEETDLLETLEAPQALGTDHPHAETVDRVLAQLKPEDRLIVTLHYYQQFTLSEVSHHLDWGLSKTKVRCHRARKALQRLLQEEGVQLN